jgi:hypothetical protein
MKLSEAWALAILEVDRYKIAPKHRKAFLNKRVFEYYAKRK